MSTKKQVEELVSNKIEIDESTLTNLLKKLQDLESKINASTKEVTNDLKNIPTTSKFKSPLMPGKKVQIVPIKKSGNAFINDADQATMLRGTGKGIMCPLDSKIFRLIDPLEQWEKEYLEDVLKINLNVNSTNDKGEYNSFYTKPESRIILKKNGSTIESATRLLDLGNPFDYLLYKICLISPRVANKWQDRFNLKYEFVLKDIDAELVEEVAHNDKEDKVLEYLLEIKSNKKALFDLLRLYGNTQSTRIKVTLDNTVEFMYNELKKVTKSIKGVRDLYNIISLADVSPQRLQMMVFIEDALACGSLERHGVDIRMPGGNSVGHSINEAINFMELPENQAIRMKITKDIEKYLTSRK